MDKPADWQIEWIDRGREPQCAPNPAYPDGIDIDTSHGAAETCSAPLARPTPRCGYYVVKCRRCRQTVMITTAGRPDDPRSLKLKCKAVA